MTELVTLEEYKQYKDIRNPEHEGRLQVLVVQVSALIENYCNRKFLEYYNSPYRTEWFNGNTNSVTLTEFPVREVFSVMTSSDGGVTQIALVENTDYFVDLEHDKVITSKSSDKFISDYNTPFRSLEINYQAGYSTTNLPKDLKLAVFDLIEYYNDEQKHPSKSLLGATIDNPLPTISSQFPPHIKRILDLYRLSY